MPLKKLAILNLISEKMYSSLRV